MSKLLISSIVITLSTQAGTFDIVKFVKTSVVKNPQVKTKSVDTISVKKIPGDNNWNAHLVIANLTYKGKKIKEPMSIFVNEKTGLATMGLIDMKTGVDYAKIMKPSMPDSFYDDAHRISGTKDSKHKLVIFSDPQCPFCIQYVPSAIAAAKKNPTEIAVYYYHMPLLRLHPVSDVLTRVMEVLQKEGKLEDAIKVYKLKISAKEKDETKILAALKKQLNIVVSKESINKPDIKDAVKSDMSKATDMMVRGTPTVYFDGEFDESRNKYKKFIK